MKRALSIGLRAVVAASVLFYLFRYQVDLPKLLERLREVRWGWIGAALALFGVTFGSGAMRWFLLLRSQAIRIPLHRVWLICFVGQFFNAFMLGGTGGDLIKAYYASQQTPTHKPEAVTSVLVDRLVGLFGLFTVVVVMVALNFRVVQSRPGLRWPVLVVFLIIGAAAVLIPLSIWSGSGRRIPGLARLAKRWPAIEHLQRAVQSYRGYAQHRRVLVWTWLWSLLIHLSNFTGAVFLGKGLGITAVGWNEYFLLVPLINTISSMPITVAGFGVREELYRRTFGEFGVATEPAVALGLINYLVQLCWSLAGGVVYLLWKHEPAMLQHARADKSLT